MRLPVETRRYCPYCRKHTVQKISVAKQKSRSATHPMSRGSTTRLEKRGFRVGYGNQGKYSRKGPKDWKRKSKMTRRLAVQYTCKTCGKAKGISKAIRTSRIEVGEKVAK
jgi:large subunit ribosomal protein L44e